MAKRTKTPDAAKAEPKKIVVRRTDDDSIRMTERTGRPVKDVVAWIASQIDAGKTEFGVSLKSKDDETLGGVDFASSRVDVPSDGWYWPMKRGQDEGDVVRTSRYDNVVDALRAAFAAGGGRETNVLASTRDRSKMVVIRVVVRDGGFFDMDESMPVAEKWLASVVSKTKPAKAPAAYKGSDDPMM
jgi:hypothetical protein